MRLKKMLAMLSKSSPYAVSTDAKIIDPELERIKKYLYVETDIERAFKTKLGIIKPHEIIFLCGSSGDGKSEILTRYKEEYKMSVDFHLDATHSFEPKTTAVETLDKLFSDFYASDRPLVVGINIGMMGNYEREGDEKHSAIKSAIKSFLDGGARADKCSFIDFESFPKFLISEGEVQSEFFSKLLQNIVRDDAKNPFKKYFDDAIAADTDKTIVANLLLLRNKCIQKMIIELLLCARIGKDQFITARMLLDFIYCLLTGPGYLFDNLFSGGENELLKALQGFDPSIIRNKKLDLFVIHRALDFEDDLFTEFSTELNSKFKVAEELSAQSIIRCFFLLKNTVLENNYHKQFKDSFNETAIELYKITWQQHKDYDNSTERKVELKRFYNEVVLLAINKYANRDAPYLTKDEFYISSHGESDLAAEVDLSISYADIETDDLHDISNFRLHIKVNNELLPPVQVNVNLLAMMLNIVNGFRPNKHDKNSVVLLDELINNITEHASNSKVLFLHRKGSRIKLKNNPDGDIRVSGL